MKDERLKPCPFCGEAPSIFICDSEGNIHDEDYLTRPYSGLYFALRHEIKEEQPNEEICPIATHPYEILGTQLYESIDELVERWNNLKIQPIPSFDEILEANRDVWNGLRRKAINYDTKKRE